MLNNDSLKDAEVASIRSSYRSFIRVIVLSRQRWVCVVLAHVFQRQ